mmetsp:Transcript_37174/g.50311  ORF Transcript_37174/g.50311 Transcript_37174/m.50311 type:complete len:138 (-) Transcript_37174:50-463(-)
MPIQRAVLVLNTVRSLQSDVLNTVRSLQSDDGGVMYISPPLCDNGRGCVFALGRKRPGERGAGVECARMCLESTDTAPSPGDGGWGETETDEVSSDSDDDQPPLPPPWLLALLYTARKKLQYILFVCCFMKKADRAK